MNKPKEISNKAIKQNNIAELYSKIYIEILKSEISYFLGRLENNFTDRDIPSEIIDLLRDMERYIILRQKTWPKIKEYFCYLIEIKEAAEQRRLEERQIDDKYGFLYADIQEYIQNSQRLKEKAKRKIELRKNIIKNL